MLCARFLSIVVLSLAGIPGESIRPIKRTFSGSPFTGGVSAVCLADISLTLPDFDPSPLSANILGVGPNNETTYQIVPLQITDSQDPGNFGTGRYLQVAVSVVVVHLPTMRGTVTLVEGPGNLVLEAGGPMMSNLLIESCALTNGMMDCMDALVGATTFYVDYAVSTPIVMQGGGTVTPGPTSTVDPGAQTTSASGGAVPQGSTATQTAGLPSESASLGVRLTPAVKIMAGMWFIWAVLA